MSTTDRIRTERHVVAMVAPDTVRMLAERMKRLVAGGRRFAASRTVATHTGRPARVYPGLVAEQVRADARGAFVTCEGFGFGFDVEEWWEDHDEAHVWERFHAGQHEADAYRDRRIRMTQVTLTGGREGDGPCQDDEIVIRRYNSEGVCSETVIGFERV